MNVGTTIYTNQFGKLTVVSVEADVVKALLVEKNIPFYGELGRPGTRTTEVQVPIADCMDEATWDYRCWSGEAGAGLELRTLIANSNKD